MNARFLEPLDVLFLRGNKLFGDPGSYGEAIIPPLPSVAAGAIRSRMLADADFDLTAFAESKIPHPELGTPDAPGAFTVTAFHLARRGKDGEIEPLFAPPADLNLALPEGRKFPKVTALKPTVLVEGIGTSFPLPQLPALVQDEREKSVSGWWLTAAGWARYLAGGIPDQAEHWIKSDSLWTFDERIGIGMNASTRSVEEGKLFSMQGIAFRHGVGFIVVTQGGEAPKSGSLRFGGDGRAVAIESAETQFPEPDYAAIAKDKRCRLILTTPGLFERGWLPTGATEAMDFELHGMRGKIVSAAVPRFETISGWDLANCRPKAAQRAAPTGSVYWLDELETDEMAIRKLVETGLWRDPCDNSVRRAEGFNRCTLTAWIKEGEK